MKNKSLSIISLVFAFTLAFLVCLGGLTAGASGGLWITDGFSVLGKSKFKIKGV